MYKYCTSSFEMAPVIVKFEDKYNPNNVKISKAQKKVLRSGKPISTEQLLRKQRLEEKRKLKGRRHTKDDEDNTKNDLQLQRLLDESHILSGGNQSHEQRFSGAELTLESMALEGDTIGSSRVRTLSERMKKLSETNGGSDRKLENMPMSIRKGMIRAQMRRISKYEEEAREAGIVLSKNRKGQFRKIHDSGSSSFTERIGTGVKKQVRLRDRGLKINSVGKATSHGVILSKHDIAKITGGDRRKRGRRDRR